MWIALASHDDVDELVPFGPFGHREDAQRACQHVNVHDGWWSWPYRLRSAVEVEQVLAAEMDRAVGLPDFRL